MRPVRAAAIENQYHLTNKISFVIRVHHILVSLSLKTNKSLSGGITLFRVLAAQC